ncbi:MAG: hydroxyisourate hydrolase [Pirellulales bacterium]
MGRLSTHVLDTAQGKPAGGVRLELVRLDGERGDVVATATTNADGRTDEPLLSGPALTAGKYRLRFHVGDYFTARGVAGAGQFLDVVPVDIIIVDPAASYHVPLLVSPWSYSTYRGS